MERQDDRPLGARTDWFPNNRHGAQITTHRLVRVSPQRLEFRRSPAMYTLLGLLVLLALAPGYAAVHAFIDAMPIFAVLMLALAGSVLALCVYLSRRAIGTAVFDREAGEFFHVQGSEQVHRARLDDIAGVQVLCEIFETTSYHDGTTQTRKTTSWELNVVLHNGDRYTVVDHAGGGRIVREARELADWLGVPLLGV